jgi:hypothetical protein
MPQILVLIGLIIAFFGLILWIIEAFKENILWGVSGFVFSPVLFLFLIFHWDKARKPFFINIGGVVIALLGVYIGGGSVAF